MSSSQPLQSLNILVTRPRGQAESLCQGIQQLGGQALHYPMLDLQATPCDPSVAAAKAQLAHYDLIIFISANAVHFSLPLLPRLSTPLAAIGSATARALSAEGYTDVLQPETDFSSEGLLQLETLQYIKGWQILIVRGRGGREILKQRLQERGAQVDYLECYCRQKPTLELAPLRQRIRRQEVAVICCSSAQALDHLIQLVSDPELFDTAFLAVSQRLTDKARRAGFKQLLNPAINATDAAILKALCHYAQSR